MLKIKNASTVYKSPTKPPANHPLLSMVCIAVITPKNMLITLIICTIGLVSESDMGMVIKTTANTRTSARVNITAYNVPFAIPRAVVAPDDDPDKNGSFIVYLITGKWDIRTQKPPGYGGFVNIVFGFTQPQWTISCDCLLLL